MTGLGPELDAARARVVERGLTEEAVSELTPVVSALSLDALAPVKQLVKRFFSSEPWTDSDDEALAEAAAGGGHHPLLSGPPGAGKTCTCARESGADPEADPGLHVPSS
jgi:hypothetical protein